MLKTLSTIPYPISLIRSIVTDSANMTKWDKTFSKRELLQSFPAENGVSKAIWHNTIKFPVFMTDRDLVVEEKVWTEHNNDPKAILMMTESTTNSSCPPKDKPIRAEIIIGGAYFYEKSANETLCARINNVDLKLTTGADVVNAKIPDNEKDYVDNLTKQCKSKS